VTLSVEIREAILVAASWILAMLMLAAMVAIGHIG